MAEGQCASDHWRRTGSCPLHPAPKAAPSGQSIPFVSLYPADRVPLLACTDPVLPTSWPTAVTLGGGDEEPRPVTVRDALGLGACGLRCADMLTDRQNRCFLFAAVGSPQGSLVQRKRRCHHMGSCVELCRGRESALLSACGLGPAEPEPVGGPFSLWSRPACRLRDGQRPWASYSDPFLPASSCLGVGPGGTSADSVAISEAF